MYGSLLLLRFSVSFRAVRSSFSASLVLFERFGSLVKILPGTRALIPFSTPINTWRNRSKRSREFEKEGQTVRKGLENLRKRSEPVERDLKSEKEERTGRKGIENLTQRRKPVERDERI